MTEPSLYLILLKDSNFLIHASRFKEEQRVFTECIILYEFARKYEPVNMELLCTATSLEECDSTIDFYIKQYMVLYGIDHVRGGMYKTEALSEYLLRTLFSNLKTRDGFHEKIQELLDDTMKSYEKDIYEPIYALEYKKKESEMILTKYNNEYNEYISMKTYEDQSITCDMLEEIQWFANFVSANDNKIEEETKKKYKHFLSTVKILFKKFIEVKKRESLISDEMAYTNFIKNEFIIRLLHPEFEFDVYMYHPTTRTFLTENQIQFAKEFLQEIEYMYYTVINCCDNYEYIVSNYPNYIVDICELKTRYYTYLIGKRTLIK
jgi:exopolyphosphatase/pppGpp-phosphohydrolase